MSLLLKSSLSSDYTCVHMKEGVDLLKPAELLCVLVHILHARQVDDTMAPR